MAKNVKVGDLVFYNSFYQGLPHKRFCKVEKIEIPDDDEKRVWGKWFHVPEDVDASVGFMMESAVELEKVPWRVKIKNG